MIEPEDQALFQQKRWEPYAANIDLLARHGLNTTDQALFIHGMFLEWDASHEHTYAQFRRAVRRHQAVYDEYLRVGQHGGVEFTRLPRGDIAERIGVAGALTIASAIFEVTEADFRRIPVTSKAKSFDYDLTLEALGPDYELAVEAKGTHDGKSTRAHVSSIRAKKTETKGRRKTIRFGVVTDLATSPDHESKVVLVDPPGEDGDDSVEFERLRLRLQFYLRRLQLLTAQGRMTVALANRISSIREDNWKTLDGRELVGARLERLPVDRFPGINLRSRQPPRMDIHARIFPLKEEHDWGEYVLCYVHGLETRVLKALVLQNHSELLELKSRQHFFEPDSRDMEGYLSVLPSGVVGGLSYVAREFLPQTQRADAPPLMARRRRARRPW